MAEHIDAVGERARTNPEERCAEEEGERRKEELNQLLATHRPPPDLAAFVNDEPRLVLFGPVYDFLTALDGAAELARTDRDRLILYTNFRLWAAQLVGWFAGPRYIPGGYDLLIDRVVERLGFEKEGSRVAFHG